jgi:suppressor of G2 allele of SKP1
MLGALGDAQSALRKALELAQASGSHLVGTITAQLTALEAKTGAAAAPAPAAPPAAAQTAPSTASAASAPISATSSSAVGLKKPRYEWYQSQSHVNISLLVKDVDPARSTVKVLQPGQSDGQGGGHEGATLSISLALPSGGEFVLDLDLFDNVKPLPVSPNGSASTGSGESSVTYRATKVEIKLAKADSALYTWPALEASAAPVAPGAIKAKLAGTAAPTSLPSAVSSAPQRITAPQPVAAAAAPASSASSSSSSSSATAASAAPRAHKDWSKLEKDLEAEADEKPEGEAALYKLFRDIYAKGDEETRKAMVKSFQTSGGTVLSTNWKDVKEKDFEKEMKEKEKEGGR